MTPGGALTPGGAGAPGVSTTPPGESQLDGSKPLVSAAPLRRMTRAQYDDSIRDLLGVEEHPSLALAADEKLAAFFSNSISPVSRLSVERIAIQPKAWRRSKTVDLSGFV